MFEQTYCMTFTFGKQCLHKFYSLYPSNFQNGESLSRDCAEYDACIELELLNIQPCYKFPGNSAYDAQCIDIPADEYVPGTAGYRYVYYTIKLHYYTTL